MGRVTTHVLDTANGCPGAGIRIDVYGLAAGRREHLKTVLTNEDGRCDEPVLEAAALQQCEYELEFHVAEYFRKRGVQLPETPFLGDVVIRFGVSEPGEHYHVPLLISPYSYTTYRGS